MATLQVFWYVARPFREEEQSIMPEGAVQTGILTDDPDELLDEDQPVVIEDETGRVYSPGDFPPDTVIYVEESPGGLPPLAQKAAAAGFRVRHAEEGAPSPDASPNAGWPDD